MFLVHLTREDILQSYQPSKPTVESESTISSVHDTLAFTVCNEILSAPDSFQTKVLVKILSSLQITTNNYVGLRELSVLSEQLLTHVREKLCRKSLEKFAKNISDWLARDPSKAIAADKRPSSVAEMRPLDETAACTPGKKKRFLFSQSSMNNSLLDPDKDETSRADVTEVGSLFGTPRRIPSPVPSRDQSKSRIQESLESTIEKTKDLEISENTAANSTLSKENDDETMETDTDASDERVNGVESLSSVVPDTPTSRSIPSSQVITNQRFDRQEIYSIDV